MFSGQQDPEWKPGEETLKKLLDYCEVAQPYEYPFEMPSRLGYRGVMLYNDKQTITAFNGKMEIKSGQESIVKTDLGRKLEQMILMDAPQPFKPLALNQLTTDFD